MKNISRRKLLGATVTAILSAPMLNLLSRSVVAAESPPVDPDDAQAKALSYTHTSPKSDQKYSNCQLFAAAADSQWGPCAIFPGKQVANAGWCSAWVKRAG
jgi:hypothetical protein